MSTLFGADQIRILRTAGMSFEIHDPSGIVALAKFRSPDPDWRNLFTVLDKHRRPGTDFVVVDPDGTSHYEINLERGWDVQFAFRVSTSAGEAVGTGQTSGRFRMKVPTELVDATGAPMGHTFRGRRWEAFDHSDTPVATIHQDSTAPAFGKLVHRIEFTGQVSAPLRAMIVASVVCWATNAG
ncbi:hypothetical protein, partial [Nocardioides sp. AE5]|uniref:hypothetical protein n=1 Tax=Nocardioides sp. AE5 TaxID=2962573 RepID=UPI002881D5DD